MPADASQVYNNIDTDSLSFTFGPFHYAHAFEVMAETSYKYVPSNLVPSMKFDRSNFSFVELQKPVSLIVLKKTFIRQDVNTHCAPSSPLPMGSNKTFTPRLSAKVSVTGIDPPSRVKSGVFLYTA